MENENNFVTHRVLIGRKVEEPEYREQLLSEYIDNPFIEALPDIFTKEKVADFLSSYPPIVDGEKELPPEIRYHMCERLRRFYQPLSKHFDIERKFSVLIRNGYIGRNPFSIEFFTRLDKINKLKMEDDELKIEKLESLKDIMGSTASSFSIIGLSGVGKTKATEKILLMYPQVIRHNEYKNKSFSRTQIVWLKIDTPHDGSLKTLCKMFFSAVDDVLGTTRYFQMFGHNRNSTATMMIHMTYITTLYNIGILVIDEVQNLINSKNASKDILNFFITLINTIGIPVVFVGTPAASDILTQCFSQARRMSNEGIIFWDRMDGKSAEWDFFISSIWEYQWVRNFTAMDQQLKEVIFDESQGITSLVIVLFILAQQEVLGTSNERISAKLIRSIAGTYLKHLNGMIDALRKNETKKLRMYGDIDINISQIICNAQNVTKQLVSIRSFQEQQNLKKEEGKNNLKVRLLKELVDIGIFSKLNDKLEGLVDKVLIDNNSNQDYLKIKQKILELALEESIRLDNSIKRRHPDNKTIKKEMNELSKLYEKADIEKKEVYELLKEEGYIKNPVGELIR